MSCHVSACPNHQTNRTTPFSTRGAIASLGPTGYELDVTKLTEEDKCNIKMQIDRYKHISALILNGDLYRLRNPFTGQDFCETVVSKDKKRIYGVYLALEDVNENRVYLSGLDENMLYQDAFSGVSYQGKQLMEDGIVIPDLKKYESYVFEFNMA
jgi:alpha-galactosidase